MEIILTGAGVGPQSRGASTSQPPASDNTEFIVTSGQGYAPGDTSILAGGTLVSGGVPTTVTITETQAVSATIVNGGSGGTPGAAQVIGTTGAGAKFVLDVTISGTGDQTALTATGGGGSGYLPGDTVTLTGGTGTPPELQVNLVGLGATGWTLSNAGTGGTPGTYTGAAFTLAAGFISPYNPTFEGTIGAGGNLTSLTVWLPGAFYVVPPPFGSLTDIPLSGHGLAGATITITEFEIAIGNPSPINDSVSIVGAGDMTVVPSNPVAQGSSSGAGTGATFDLTWSSGSGSISAINDVAINGDYTINPTVPSNEPVADDSSSGIAGAAVNVVMGVLAAVPTVPGQYIGPPVSPISEASTSGTGTGAEYQFIYSGDTTAGSVIFDEIPLGGSPSVNTSFTSDPSNNTSAEFTYPSSSTVDAVVATSIKASANAASFNGTVMTLASSTNNGSPGLFSGQLSVEMRTFDAAAHGTGGCVVQEVQILVGVDPTRDAAILAAIEAYYGL